MEEYIVKDGKKLRLGYTTGSCAAAAAKAAAYMLLTGRDAPTVDLLTPKGIAVSILGTFPEQAKLAEIAKYSHYVVQPVKFAEDGALVEEEPPKPKKAPPRRRFR